MHSRHCIGPEHLRHTTVQYVQYSFLPPDVVGGTSKSERRFAASQNLILPQSTPGPLARSRMDGDGF